MRISIFSSTTKYRSAMCGIAAFVLLGAASAKAQSRNLRNISVTVSDTVGNPVADAIVTVTGTSFRGLSDEQGQVEFRNVDWGPQQLTVRKLGFREVSQAIVVPANGSVAMGIILSRVAVVLGKVVVSDTGGKPARLAGTTRFDGFYQRRKTGSGTFMTREEITARNPGRTFDLFKGVAGLRLTYRGLTPLLSFARCKSGVQIFVDGQRLNDGLNEMAGIHPNQIEAIEIYHGLASVPPQFIPKPDDCAAVVIWTRYY